MDAHHLPRCIEVVLAAFAIAARAEDPPPPGYVVLVGAPLPDEARALVALAGTFDQGVPSHAEYPTVVPLAPYDRVGYGIAVAVPRQREVADRLVRSLVERGLVAEALPTTALPSEDLYVFAADAVRVTGNGAPLFPYEICLGPPSTDECWASGTLDDELHFVVPFLAVPTGTLAALKVKAGHPWTCPNETMGVAKQDLPVWLKSPVRVACFEDSTPNKRKPPR